MPFGNGGLVEKTNDKARTSVHASRKRQESVVLQGCRKGRREPAFVTQLKLAARMHCKRAVTATNAYALGLLTRNSCATKLHVRNTSRPLLPWQTRPPKRARFLSHLLPHSRPIQQACAFALDRHQMKMKRMERLTAETTCVYCKLD